MSRGAVRTAQVLLTVSAFEFFGPIFRDYGASHAFNPDWTGHARVHLVWLLGFMGFSGLANLYLVWVRRDLQLSVVWQACNLGGFWVAWVLAPSYGGQITVPGIHVHVLGYDENVFVFAVLSVVLVAAQLVVFTAGADERR